MTRDRTEDTTPAPVQARRAPLSEDAHATIRWVAGAGALVVCVVLIVLTFRYNIQTSHQVQSTCIEHGGSWVGGQCIQVPGGRP